MVGVPVIINHKDLSSENVGDERVGVVNSVWYDEKDGWYWCDGIIWDETAQNLITDNNWSVSCSYDVKTADDKGGTENNIKYDIEFLDGVFTHLALVNNPRYERANIVFNSKLSFKDEFINTFYEALAEVVVENCLGESRAKNGKNEPKDWITIKGNHIPVEEDESKKEVAKKFVEDKQEKKKKQQRSLTELLGEEVKDVKGQQAINRLCNLQKGYVKKAFYRDVIGDIGIFWGDSTCGLKHIIEHRKDQNIEPKEFIKGLGKVIEKGKIDITHKTDRWILKYEGKKAIITKELRGEKFICLLTAFL